MRPLHVNFRIESRPTSFTRRRNITIFRSFVLSFKKKPLLFGSVSARICIQEQGTSLLFYFHKNPLSFFLAQLILLKLYYILVYVDYYVCMSVLTTQIIAGRSVFVNSNNTVCSIFSFLSPLSQAIKSNHCH